MKIVIDIPEKFLPSDARWGKVAAQYVRKMADQIEEGWNHGRVPPTMMDSPVDWTIC